MEGDWLAQLKRACEAGYYKTESEVGKQSTFPWQNKTCQDCPFWSHGICWVHSRFRRPSEHTCRYFDAPHRDMAHRILREHGRDNLQPKRERFYPARSFFRGGS